MGRTMLDFIEAAARAEKQGKITLEEFSAAMRSGDESRIEDAVERMEAAGGYDNLD